MFTPKYKIIEAHGEELALFQTPETNTAVQSIEEFLYRPVSQLASSSSYLEFSIPGNSTHYLDLSKTRLNLQIRIVKQDGSPIGVDDPVTLINLPSQTIFSQVDVSLNQVPVCKLPQPLYAYKSYLDTLLMNGEESKESYLQSELWFHDMAGEMDNVHPVGDVKDAGLNPGLVLRHAYTAGSKIVDLEGSLHIDFFNQPRYLINGVSVHIKLWQSSDPFRLMAGGDNPMYKVEIIDAVLKVTGVSVTPEVILGHSAALKKMPVLYPFIQSDFRTYSVPQGSLNFVADNMWNGHCPSKAIVFLTSSQAYNGSFKANPFNLQNCKLNYLSFTLDGVTKGMSKALQPDYQNDNYIEAYVSTFTGNNMYGKNTGNDISRHAYKNGYCYYFLDIDGQHSTSCMPMIKKGHTRIEVKFAEPLKESFNLVIYGKFPTTVQVDEARNVIV